MHKLKQIYSVNRDLSATIVCTAPNRYVVTIRDEESGNTLPTAIIYRDYETAYSYAVRCITED